MLTSRRALMWGVIVWLAGIPGKPARAQQPPAAPVGDETRIITPEMTGPYRPRSKPNLDRVRQLVIDQTNAFRKQQKLPPLVEQEQLAKTAQEFADYMANNNRYGHEADGRTIFQRVKAQDYDYCYIGENIAFFFRSTGYATAGLADACMTGWKESPPHRENMLRPYVGQTGVGVAQSADTGAFFAVQLVGRPRSEQIKVEVVNETQRRAELLVGPSPVTIEPGRTWTLTMCLPEEIRFAGQPGQDPPPKTDASPRFAIREQEGKLTIVPLPQDSPPPNAPAP